MFTSATKQASNRRCSTLQACKQSQNIISCTYMSCQCGLISGSAALHALHFVYGYDPFIHHSSHAIQSADQERCNKHSMAALQPALSWDALHHVNERPINCQSSLTKSTHCFWLLPLTPELSICQNSLLLGSRSSGILAKWPSYLNLLWLTIFEMLATLHQPKIDSFLILSFKLTLQWFLRH